jgi:light-regulated signal transduction histidine kinase (bacteriophytochrome)
MTQLAPPPQAESQIAALQFALAESRAELELVSADMDGFASSLTHDLDAPLRQISGFAELLVQSANGGLNETSTRHLTRIVESVERMRRMLEELRLLSWASRAEALLQHVPVKPMVEAVIAEVMTESPARKIAWRIGPLEDVEADEFLLRQVWLKLIQNAVKFSAKQSAPEIDISSVTSGQTVTYRVADNGIGFEPEFAERIFMAFQRLRSEKEFHGAGMGLAIVRRIVRRQGGTTWASGQPDKGAEFFFSLPRRQMDLLNNALTAAK